jgi:hypothetical protein
MATRRMISKEIFGSDKFRELSPKARLLYVYIILYSDDQGFNNEIKKVMWETSSTNRELKTLIDKGYVIQFNSGVCLVAHWLLMNKVSPSRAQESSFSKEMENVIENEDHVYTMIQQDADTVQTIRKQIIDSLSETCQQNVNKV